MSKLTKKLREVFCWRGTVYYERETSKDFDLAPLHDAGQLNSFNPGNDNSNLYGLVYEELYNRGHILGLARS